MVAQADEDHPPLDPHLGVRGHDPVRRVVAVERHDVAVVVVVRGAAVAESLAVEVDDPLPRPRIGVADVLPEVRILGEQLADGVVLPVVEEDAVA